MFTCPLLIFYTKNKKKRLKFSVGQPEGRRQRWGPSGDRLGLRRAHSRLRWPLRPQVQAARVPLAKSLRHAESAGSWNGSAEHPADAGSCVQGLLGFQSWLRPQIHSLDRLWAEPQSLGESSFRSRGNSLRRIWPGGTSIITSLKIYSYRSNKLRNTIFSLWGCWLIHTTHWLNFLRLTNTWQSGVIDSLRNMINYFTWYLLGKSSFRQSWLGSRNSFRNRGSVQTQICKKCVSVS